LSSILNISSRKIFPLLVRKPIKQRPIQTEKKAAPNGCCPFIQPILTVFSFLFILFSQENPWFPFNDLGGVSKGTKKCTYPHASDLGTSRRYLFCIIRFIPVKDNRILANAMMTTGASDFAGAF
jgi:hypothetical protein